MGGQIQRVSHVRTRDDPAVVQQGRGFQRVRRPLGKEGNALKAIRTLRLDAADVTVHGRPALPHVVEHGQAPEQQGQAEQPRREVRRGLEHVAGRRLIQHGGEGVPLADQMARHKVEQGAAAREHHRRFRKQARRLEEDVARPGVHNPGKRPAPEGDRALHRAHGDDDVSGPQIEDFLTTGGQDAILFQEPDRRFRQVFRAGTPEAPDKLRAVAVIGGLGKTLLRARSRDMAVDLAAGKSLFVHKDDFKPGFGYDAGGAQPGRTRADDEGIPLAAHRSCSLSGYWRLMSMPSRTIVRQA